VPGIRFIYAYTGNRIAEKLCRDLFKLLSGLNDRWTAEQLKNLAYVGMTRARYRLVMPYVIENEIIRQLKILIDNYPSVSR
jgi:hypothetical protein